MSDIEEFLGIVKNHKIDLPWDIPWHEILKKISAAAAVSTGDLKDRYLKDRYVVFYFSKDRKQIWSTPDTFAYNTLHFITDANLRLHFVTWAPRRGFFFKGTIPSEKVPAKFRRNYVEISIETGEPV